MDALKLLPQDNRITVSVKDREDSRGEKYDRALTEAPADIYIASTDSSPILRPAFDQMVVNAARLYPDEIGVVNLMPMANASFPALQAITQKLVDKLGHIYSHEYPFWFIDHEMDDISRMIGRNYCVDVKVDVSYNNQNPEKRTVRMHDVAFWAYYFDLMYLERRLKARSIIMDPDFESPQWLKEVLCNSYQVVEARSRFINAGVRSSAAEIEKNRGEKSPPDEGYLRAKAKAENKVAGLLNQLAA